MSATNRGSKRDAHDFYATPAWCVRRIMERVWLPGGEWVEPAAGNGAIVRAVEGVASGMQWQMYETNEVHRVALGRMRKQGDEVYIEDFIEADPERFEKTQVIIGNPPYSRALDFVYACVDRAPFVLLLLRLNFLASAKRSSFFRDDMPDVYVLPNRPSFTGKGTDATEYAWFVWTPDRNRSSGRLEILPDTDRSQRGT